MTQNKSRFKLIKGNLETQTIPDETDKNLIHFKLKYTPDEKGYTYALIDSKTNKTLDLAFTTNPKRVNELQKHLQILTKYEEYLC